MVLVLKCEAQSWMASYAFSVIGSHILSTLTTRICAGCPHVYDITSYDASSSRTYRNLILNSFPDLVGGERCPGSKWNLILEVHIYSWSDAIPQQYQCIQPLPWKRWWTPSRMVWSNFEIQIGAAGTKVTSNTTARGRDVHVCKSLRQQKHIKLRKGLDIKTSNLTARATSPVTRDWSSNGPNGFLKIQHKRSFPGFTKPVAS